MRGEGRGSRVEVRRIGGTRVLRVDGTFASFYRPGEVRSGPVWDAIAAPIAFLPPSRRGAIALLGLGAGSVARMARALAPRARIVGVEIDPEVVRAARDAFDLDELGVEVVLADARAWLARERGSYDAVLEDIFVGSARDVRKPRWLPEPGLAQAARLLRAGGLLASNDLEQGLRVERAIARVMPGSVRIGVVGWENRILVGGPAALSGRTLRAAVAAEPLLRPRLPDLRFATSPSSASP